MKLQSWDEEDEWDSEVRSGGRVEMSKPAKESTSHAVSEFIKLPKSSKASPVQPKDNRMPTASKATPSKPAALLQPNNASQPDKPDNKAAKQSATDTTAKKPLLAEDQKSKPAPEMKTYARFDDMSLHDDVLRGLFAYGFAEPSEVQQRAIVPICKGLDVLVQAQSGTGKTATFCVGILQSLIRAREQNDRYDTYKGARAIVLSPTRELAKQTADIFSRLSLYVKWLKSCLVMGGTEQMQDIANIRDGRQVIIGTPGRIQHFISTNLIDVSRLQMIVLDEADNIVGRGFREVMEKIFDQLPHECQRCFVSATYTPNCVEWLNTLVNPQCVRILIPNADVSLEGIQQFYVMHENADQKFDSLVDLYSSLSISQSMVFVNRKEQADVLTDFMRQKDFPVSTIHADMSSEERMHVMQEFRMGQSRVLISTDLTARGIDVPSVFIVINFDVPLMAENYIHRIGRSGRFGRKGVAITFITDEDQHSLAAIQAKYHIEIKELGVKDMENIQSKKR